MNRTPMVQFWSHWFATELDDPKELMEIKHALCDMGGSN